MIICLIIAPMFQESDIQDLFSRRITATPANQFLLVPREVRFIEENTLPRHEKGPRQPDTQQLPDPQRMNPQAPLGDLGLLNQPRGQRLLAFSLAPGEGISLRQAGPSPQRIRLRFLPTPETMALVEDMRRANRRTLGAAGPLDLLNVAPTPVQILMEISGPTGVPYKLEVKRQGP